MKGSKMSESEWENALGRIKEGAKVAEVAKEFGVTRATIYGKLGAKSNISAETLEMGRLKRENKALRELVGKITYDLSKEKKEI